MTIKAVVVITKTVLLCRDDHEELNTHYWVLETGEVTPSPNDGRFHVELVCPMHARALHFSKVKYEKYVKNMVARFHHMLS